MSSYKLKIYRFIKHFEDPTIDDPVEFLKL